MGNDITPQKGFSFLSKITSAFIAFPPYSTSNIEKKLENMFWLSTDITAKNIFQRHVLYILRGRNPKRDALSKS